MWFSRSKLGSKCCSPHLVSTCPFRSRLCSHLSRVNRIFSFSFAQILPPQVTRDLNGPDPTPRGRMGLLEGPKDLGLFSPGFFLSASGRIPSFSKPCHGATTFPASRCRRRSRRCRHRHVLSVLSVLWAVSVGRREWKWENEIQQVGGRPIMCGKSRNQGTIPRNQRNWSDLCDMEPLAQFYFLSGLRT